MERAHIIFIPSDDISGVVDAKGPRVARYRCAGHIDVTKLPPVSRKPWKPVPSANNPTICPFALMPKASVKYEPGTSRVVKLPRV